MLYLNFKWIAWAVGLSYIWALSYLALYFLPFIFTFHVKILVLISVYSVRVYSENRRTAHQRWPSKSIRVEAKPTKSAKKWAPPPRVPKRLSIKNRKQGWNISFTARDSLRKSATLRWSFSEKKQRFSLVISKKIPEENQQKDQGTERGFARMHHFAWFSLLWCYLLSSSVDFIP